MTGILISVPITLADGVAYAMPARGTLVTSLDGNPLEVSLDNVFWTALTLDANNNAVTAAPFIRATGDTQVIVKQGSFTVSGSVPGEGSPGSTAGEPLQIQYNNGGFFGGVWGVIWDAVNEAFQFIGSISPINLYGGFSSGLNDATLILESVDDTKEVGLQIKTGSDKASLFLTSDDGFAEIIIGGPSPAQNKIQFYQGEMSFSSNGGPLFTMRADGLLICANIPNADPGVPGALYHTAGAVMVSL